MCPVPTIPKGEIVSVAAEVELAYRQHEVGTELVEDDEIDLEPNAVPPHKALSTRRIRRRIMRRRLRGVRPSDDPVAVKTTPWHRHKKRQKPIHPRYTRTKLVLVPSDEGLVLDIRRKAPKPAPDEREICRIRAERKAAALELEFDGEVVLGRHHLDPDFLLEQAIAANVRAVPAQEEEPVEALADMVVVNDLPIGGPGWSVERHLVAF